jgi:hypothetical protein
MPASSFWRARAEAQGDALDAAICTHDLIVEVINDNSTMLINRLLKR